MPDETSTPRTLRHQQRYQALVQLAERAMARNPKVAALFAAEMAGVLHDDPAFATLFADRFRQPQRGALPSLVTSPLITALHNVQNLTSNVQNISGNVLNGAANALNISSLVVADATSPLLPVSSPSDSPTTSPLSPLRGKVNHLPQTTSVEAVGLSASADAPTALAKARRRDEMIDAFAAVFAGGDYINFSEREFGQVLKACGQIRKIGDKAGRTARTMAELIVLAHGNWPNVMGQTRETPLGIANNWANLVHGPQRNGRSNGVVTNHHQTLYENASVKHQPKMGLE